MIEKYIGKLVSEKILIKIFYEKYIFKCVCVCEVNKVCIFLFIKYYYRCEGILFVI